MATSLSLLRDVYRLWRRPAQQRLPLDTVFMILQDEAALLAQTLESSSTETRLLTVEYAGGIDTELPAQSYSIPRGAEYREAGDEAWTPLEIVTYRQFETRQAAGDFVATIYNSPPKIKFSEDPAGREVQLFYPFALDVPANINESPKLDEAWQKYLKYRVALRVGPLISHAGAEWADFYKTNMTMLADSRETWKKLFDTYIERDNPEEAYPTPLIEGIYDLWRKPSQKRLPMDRVFRVLQDEARLLSQGLVLSNQSQSLIMLPLTPGTQDEALQVKSLSLPKAVKTRPVGSTPETVWTDVDIVSFESFGKRQRTGDDVVTFWGQPPHIMFSLNVQGREFQLWYPFPLPVPDVVTADPLIDEAWWTYLKYSAAVTVGPLIIDNSPPVPSDPVDSKRPQISPWRTFYKDNMVNLVEKRDHWARMFKEYTTRGTAETSYKTGFNDRSDNSYVIDWPRA